MKKITLILLFIMVSTVLRAQLQLFKTELATYVLMPPEKQLAAKKIAILDFQNVSQNAEKEAGSDLGSKVTDYLTEFLVSENAGLDGKTYINGAKTNTYTIVERSRLQKVLTEQKLNASGILNENDIVKLGKILGVDAIISGSVSYSHKDEKSSRKNSDNTYTYVYKRTVTTESRMRILSVETGEIIGQTSKNSAMVSTVESTSAYLEEKSLTPPVKLAEKAGKDVGFQLCGYINPYYSQQTFVFENIKNNQMKDRIKDAKEYLKLGEIDKAYQMYKAIYDVDQYNPQLLFNLGELHEIVGNYEKARNFYGEAVAIEPDNKVYVAATNRAQNSIALAEKLSQLGMTIKEHKFAESEDQHLLAEKASVKGSKGDRTSILSEPVEQGQIVTMVPGGTQLTVINKQGDWVEVRLANGKTGFVNKKNVKLGQ